MKFTNNPKVSALIAIGICVSVIPCYAQSKSGTSTPVGFDMSRMSSVFASTPTTHAAASRHKANPSTVQDQRGTQYYSAGDSSTNTGSTSHESASPSHRRDNGPTVAHDYSGKTYTSSTGHIYRDAYGDTYVRSGNRLRAIGGPAMMRGRHR
jgi:hypothetical protein